MDPSGIIGIIGVAGQILATCTKLGLNWRDAPDDAKKFKNEIDGLHKTLWETYNHLIQNPDFISAFEGKHSAVLSNLAAPSNSDDSALLFTCKEELENVLKSLQKRLGGSRFGWERLKATFSNEKTQSAIENVQRRCQDINSKILIDNTTLAANTNLEVRYTRKHLEEKHLDEKKQKVLDWITPIDFAAQQNDNLDRRQKGTGQRGKDMLSSIVIEYLQQEFDEDPTVGTAYLFCNFRRHNEQKPRELLASILKQLCWAIPAGLNDVEKSYEKHKSPTGYTPMSTPEVIACLRSVISCFDKVYILLDALDECRGDEGCFATSRHIPEIEGYFGDAPSIEIRATDEDVMKFLDGHMYKLPKAVTKNKELQGEIKHNIVQAVQGIFLLAQLHLDSLQGKRSAKAIKDALRKLATGSSAYDNAYDEAMERIEGQLPDEETLAKEALSWIVCATRPLKTWELQHALAVEMGTAGLDEDNITELEDIVSVCAGLITIDEESDVIRLVHYTTQEFFERTSERWLPNANELIVESCITYLSFDAFSHNVFDSDTDSDWGNDKLQSRIGRNPLYDYAALEWGQHVRNISPPPERLLSFLMGSQANLDAAFAVFWCNVRLDIDWNPLEEVSGLHLAAFFGLREAFTIVLERSGIDANINIKDSQEFTPLVYAVLGGRVDFVQWLLSKDEIEVDSEYFKDGYPPIAIAAIIGEVARILPFIESDKANLDAENEEQETPLMHAVKRGHADIVKALVESDRINIELQNWKGETALMLAAADGRVEVVNYLLETGNANPNAVDDGGHTPLHHVLMAGYYSTAQWRRESPQYQAEHQEPIVRYLLDSGQVDASLPAESKGWRWSRRRDVGTPLEMALKYFGRDHPITKLLIDRMEAIGISTGATIKAWEDVQGFPYASVDNIDDTTWFHKD